LSTVSNNRCDDAGAIDPPHSIVTSIGDVQVVLRVYRQSPGIANHSRGSGTSVSRETRSTVPYKRGDCTGCIDSSDAVAVHGVAYVNPAHRINYHRRWIVQHCKRSATVVARVPCCAISCNCEYVSARVDLANAIIHCVCDVNVTGGVDVHPTRIAKGGCGGGESVARET
jgi:hypothetical protein